MKYSKNNRAKNILGLRPEGIPLDQPSELGYQCPESKGHHIEWSEYNYMIWCKTDNLDIPSPLCMSDLKKAIDIFLDIIEEINAQT